MRRNIGRKIALGVGAIVTLSLVTLFVVYLALDASRMALEQVVNEEEPASASAYEMEINVVETGLKVLKYLQTGNPADRADAAKEKNDFDRHLAKYNSLASSAEEAVLGEQVGVVYGQYWRLSEQLMDWRDAQEKRLSLSDRDAEQIDQKLHQLLQRANRAQASAKFVTLLQLETRLGELGRALGTYLRLGDEKEKKEIEHETAQFEAHLRHYRGLSLDAAERAGAEQIIRQFDTVRQIMRQGVAMQEEMTSGLERFFALRGQLDDVLDKQIQKLTAKHLEVANRDAAQAADEVRLKTVLLIPLIILLSIGVGYLLMISVTRPVRQLMAGTAAIGAGNLQYRLPPIKTGGELGDLTRRFNQMAQQLEATTVSRDSLEASEARFRTLVAALAEGVMLFDESGRILACNQAAEEILELPAERLIGSKRLDPAWQVLNENGTPMSLEISPAIMALAEGQAQQDRVVGLRKPDGALCWLAVNTRPLFETDSNRPVGAVLSFVDITQRKQAEAEILRLNAELERRVLERTGQLEAAYQELEAFSYSISHDLRAPLRAINGFANILEETERAALSEGGRELLGRVMRNAEKMGQLIDDILNFSRIGRAELEHNEVNMETQARAVVKELHPDYAHATIDLAPLPKVVGDSAMLRQVWANLIGNALKFSSKREQPKVEIGVREQDGQVVFFVRDNGCGFDPQYAGRLFGVFQRMHAAGDFTGTGVGLAIVKRIVERHQGRVWAESALDQGTTIFFTIGTDTGCAS